jgi:hypothetical protein
LVSLSNSVPLYVPMLFLRILQECFSTVRRQTAFHAAKYTEIREHKSLRPTGANAIETAGQKTHRKRAAPTRSFSIRRFQATPRHPTLKPGRRRVHFTLSRRTP